MVPITSQRVGKCYTWRSPERYNHKTFSTGCVRRQTRTVDDCSHLSNVIFGLLRESHACSAQEWSFGACCHAVGLFHSSNLARLIPISESSDSDIDVVFESFSIHKLVVLPIICVLYARDGQFLVSVKWPSLMYQRCQYYLHSRLCVDTAAIAEDHSKHGHAIHFTQVIDWSHQ